MGSLRIMGWVSIGIALAVAGMGGAPIAEYFGILWLMVGLTWLSYVAVACLAVATLLIGGLGMYHGILTVLGKEVGRISARPSISGSTIRDGSETMPYIDSPSVIEWAIVKAVTCSSSGLILALSKNRPSTNRM